MTETVKVEKIVNGKAIEIKNVIASAKITSLLTSNLGSGEVQSLRSDSEFIKMVTTGEGQYKVTIDKQNESGEKTHGSKLVTKSKIARLFELAKIVGDCNSEKDKLVESSGQFGKRGRKPLETDYSEL